MTALIVGGPWSFAVWQLRPRWQSQQNEEVRQTEQVRLETFRVRRLLIILVMLGCATTGGLLGNRFVHPFSYVAIALSVIGGAAVALLLIVMPGQALRVLRRAVIAIGLVRKRRRLRGLVLHAKHELGPPEPELADVGGPQPDRGLSDLAVADYLLGSLETAEEALASAQERAPEAEAVANNLGVVLAELGQHERAAELFARPAHEYPEELALNCALVAPLLPSPRLLEELTADEQANATAFNNVGVSYARTDDWTTAERWFERAAHAAPELPAARANAGLVAFRENRLQDAADDIMLANRQAPNEPAFASYLGVILAAAGQVDQAGFYLRRAHRVDPASVAIRINMNAIEAVRGHWQVAAKGFKSLLAAKERLADIQFNLAVCELAAQDPTAAAASAAAAIAEGDTSADAYTVLAVALWEVGRHAEALSHFASAISAPGAGPLTYSSLARALLMQNGTERALKVLEEARKQWPDDSHLESDQTTAMLAAVAAQYREDLSLAERQALLGQAQRCLGGLERALKREGDTAAEPHVNMGLYLYMHEQFEAATEHFEAAFRLEPKLKEMSFLIGTALGREGDKHTLRTEDGDMAPTAAGRQYLRRATPPLEAALEARDVLVPAAYNLARSLYVLKEYERSLAAVRKALRVDNDTELNALAALAAARQAQRTQLLYKTQMISDSKRDHLRARAMELLNVSVHYFRQALLRNELDPTLHGNLGIAYMLRNHDQDVEAALRHWERMRAIGGGAGERRYAELAQMENLADPSRVGFDDRKAKLRGVEIVRWVTVAPPRPPGIRFVIEPVAVQRPWRVATSSPLLQDALALRDMIAEDELRLARLRV